MKKVLIFTSDAGFGHRKATEAIRDALLENHSEHCSVSIINPIDDPELPERVRQMETGYDDFVKDDLGLYRLWYAATDAPVVAQLMQEVATGVMNRTLTKIIQDETPDLMVSTHPSYIQGAIRVARQAGLDIPLHVVITDLVDVHSLWFSRQAARTYAPTGNIYRLALQNGLSKRRVRLTGLPVNPRIAGETRSKAELRAALGWESDLTTLLVVGSNRSRQTAAVVRNLDRSGLDLQIIAVAGGDLETEAELRAVSYKSRVHVYGHVSNLPEMMHASDMIACKAGGLIVSESLASGLPLLLYDALPGQEVGNVKYVTDSGAGDWSPGPIGVLTTLYAWMARDQAELKKRRAAARRIGKPRAAYDIADSIRRSLAGDETSD